MGVSQTAQAVQKAVQESKDALTRQVNEVLESYQGEKADLIPILQGVQLKLGYLPEECLKQIAKYINIPESTVFGVATFYAQFKLVPTGRNVVRVCRGTGCYVRGAPRILDVLETELGIKAGETTPDLEYTLETVACFGSCALAPVMVVNDRVYGRVTAEKVKKMFGRKETLDPVYHMLGAALGWGGLPAEAATYASVYPEKNDGKTAYTLTAKDVPVDAFWSVTLYDEEGWMPVNEYKAYSFNDVTAKKSDDGSITIHFGGDPKADNFLPIVPGWSYIVRQYRPRQEILDGSWTFPNPKEADE